ncbi:MAG TPA: hypothetical protein VLA51_07400 [Paracoccaceae bacterium]|nr:hypothetical protein [Paracoccaceae bacterium]
MLGVILWSNAADRKAVIWCEDQGDLAFFTSPDDHLETSEFFDAGDLVQFDLEVHASMRRAHNPRLVIEQVGKSLPGALLERTESFGLSSNAKIIPFEPRPGSSNPASQRLIAKKG